MIIEVWTQRDGTKAVPAVYLGDFDVPVVPRIGEYIVFREGWASFKVISVDHLLWNGTAEVTLTPDYSGCYRKALEEQAG